MIILNNDICKVYTFISLIIFMYLLRNNYLLSFAIHIAYLYLHILPNILLYYSIYEHTHN